MSEENKSLIQRFVEEAFNKGNQVVLIWTAHGMHGGTDADPTDGARHSGVRHIRAHDREQEGHPRAVYLGCDDAPSNIGLLPEL